MTENEAIKNITAYVYMECENMPQQVIKALDIMKDATIEVQQYRSIGTVEECQKYKKGRCTARITFDEEKMQEIVKEQVKKFEIDIDTVLNDVIDSFIEKTEERISEIEDEYENLEEKNPYILMAKREFLNGKILAYRSAIDIIRAGGKE